MLKTEATHSTAN